MIRNIPIYVNNDYIKNLVDNENTINKINSVMYENYIICNNPFKNKKMTLGEYNNWISVSPKFTWKEYCNRFMIE